MDYKLGDRIKAFLNKNGSVAFDKGSIHRDSNGVPVKSIEATIIGTHILDKEYIIGWKRHEPLPASYYTRSAGSCTESFNYISNLADFLFSASGRDDVI